MSFDAYRQENENRAREIADELSDWRSLENNRGWARLRDFIQAQTTQRSEHVMLNPCKTLDETLEQEFSKGEYAAFRLVLRMVESEQERLTAEAERIENELKELPADENGGSGERGAARDDKRGRVDLPDSDAFGEH